MIKEKKEVSGGSQVKKQTIYTVAPNSNKWSK